MSLPQASFPPLPPGFLSELRDAGSQIFDNLPAALDGEVPSIAIRLNPEKAGALDLVPGLTDGNVPWEPLGRYLSCRPHFTFDPFLHQGAYYVQDPSSMITGHIIHTLLSHLPRRPLAYLDACAAPGGKTTAALAALPHGSIVVANEYTPARVAPLAENLARWGNPRAVITAGPVGRFTSIENSFDIIAVDAPCSGEGMMRKDPDARSQWNSGLVASCATLQRQIVADIWPALRPGGYLIYSTCTFNCAENEHNIAWIASELGAEAVEIPVDPSWGISGAVTGDLSAMRFIPGIIRGEGLFAAVLRKPGTLPETIPQPRRRTSAPSSYGPMLSSPDDFTAVTRSDGATVDLLPSSPLLHPAIARACRPVVTLGTLKGRDLIPDTSLAWSTALNPDFFPAADINADAAVSFLRREAVTLPAETPRGIILLRHGGLPLGFVKNLGNRANNLHRAAWRIISTNQAETLLTPSTRQAT